MPVATPKTIIGLTGNIGTGKSTVLAILRELGAETIDADALAHQVMAPEGAAYAGIVQAFGREVLQPGGAIDRRRLGDIVFRDAEALARLERIVHPAVFERSKALIEASARPVIVIEAIKLLEAGLSITLCDEVWVVTAPREQQIARLQAGRQMSRAEAELRIAAQPPQAAKVARADVVIDNGGTREATREQVVRAWQDLPLRMQKKTIQQMP